MSNKSNNLLTDKEQLDIYSPPILTPIERTEYFTFNNDEIKALKSFDDIAEALYFTISLVFFKLKHTLIYFTYRQVTEERRHVMQRYFPDKSSPLSFPNNRHTIIRLNNKILELCGYQRCQQNVRNHLDKKLLAVAPRYPKQRALCKALLNLCVEENIAIPKLTTLQEIVRNIWNKEQQRLLKSYKRYSTKSQRKQILSLLEKSEQTYIIVDIQQDMKSFSTSDISSALDKHEMVAPIFHIAKQLIPKLKLPKNTVDYYASLINYYKGTRLKNLNTNAVQLYLLCYCFTHYQILNDQLLEAFRKKTLDYKSNTDLSADTKAANCLANTMQLRQNISNMLLAIKGTQDKHNVPKVILFRYIPESELELAAKMIIDNSLDRDFIFWQLIDQQEKSIAINLRPLFLLLDLIILRHDELKCAVEYLQSQLNSSSTKIVNPPSSVIDWIDDKLKIYLMPNNEIKLNRFEFWLYHQLAQQIKSNKLTLKYTVKYKSVEDDLIPNKEWNKKKTQVLKGLNYSKLTSTPMSLLEDTKQINHELYQMVNHAINNGENTDIIVTHNDGNHQWRLKPLQEEKPPNDALFAQLPKNSVINVMRFVEERLNFTRAFESILPRNAKHDREPILIIAAILANALRIGGDEMARISDLNIHSIKSVENACIRMETLTSAIKLIHEAAFQFPIFKEWYIDNLAHANIDGLKLAVEFLHSKARSSPKYFGCGAGVSSVNLILNHFPMAGSLIGANEYEGHFAFELSQFQHASNIKLDLLSTDKHGINSLNFVLFYLIEIIFAPRIPKPHNEILWGFDSISNYKDYIIRPTRIMNEPIFNTEWDNIQHMVTSMLVGEASPSIIISKMGSSRFNSKTKLAFTHYNSILKSNFILRYLHDKKFRRAIERALNRGETFNRLYRAIALLNKGQLRGHSEAEMMIWDACTRLLASIVLYYNTYILNMLYETATSPEAKAFLMRVAPTAWTHLNFLGHYQFYGNPVFDLDRWIQQWNWQAGLNLG